MTKKESPCGAFVFLLLVVGFVSGCSDSRNSSFSPGEGHTAGWVLEGHAEAGAADPASCAECHGEDLDGGISNISCSDCHLGGPMSVHPEEWGTNVILAHGGFVADNGTDGCSNIFCHGSDLEGVEGSGPSCSTCHPWPFAGGGHGEDWLPSGHAEQAGTGLDQCRVCHGDELEGGIAGVACADCHLGSPTSPHPEDWGTDILTVHGSFVRQDGTDSCANQYCHGEALDGFGGAGPSCSLCHTWPFVGIHPEGWLPSGHAVEAEADISSCQVCHGEDLLGGTARVACIDCHLGNEAFIHPEEWGADVLGQHGQFALQNGTDGCANLYCHGSELDGAGVAAGPSCAQCHPWPFAGGHPPGWVPSDHKVAALADIASCQVCHGSDFAGGSVGVACTSCHMGDEVNAHPLPWGGDAFNEHRLFVIQNGAAGCSNVNCHGPNLLGVPGSGPSCTTCHGWPLGHGTATWLPSGHKANAQTDIISCQDCHGVDYSGGVARVACVDCHLGDEAAVHPRNWSNPIEDHQDFVESSGVASCSNIYCHGADLTGASGNSCFQCHGNEWD